MHDILIIEDNPQLQQAYLSALTHDGFSVLQTITGTEGLDVAREKLPDLIILDIMLPGGKNGFDILRELKQDSKTQNIPVMILTNLDSEEKAALELGAIDYILKSNTPITEIISRIKNVLQEK